MRASNARWRVPLFAAAMAAVVFMRRPDSTGARRQVPAGFLGLASMGDPERMMAGTLARVDAFRRDHGRPPGPNEIRGLLEGELARLGLFYAVAGERFQLAGWSGETAWVYDSATDAFHETRRDIARDDGYPLEGSPPPPDIGRVDLRAR